MKRLKAIALLLVVGLMIWARVFKNQPLEDVSWLAGSGPAARIALAAGVVAVFALAVWALRRFMKARRARDE